MTDFTLTHEPLTGEAVETFGPPPEPMVRAPAGRGKAIIADVARKYGLTYAEILLNTRKHHISHPRHEAMYRLRTELRYSFPQIAGMLGLLDHTSIIYGVRAHAKRLAAIAAGEAPDMAVAA